METIRAKPWVEKRRRIQLTVLSYLCIAASPFSFSHRPRSLGRTIVALAEHKSSDKKKLRRFTQRAHLPMRTDNSTTTKDAAKFNSDRMWRNNKSIDQLEKRLSARWGTELSKWTAQDNDDDDDASTEIVGETAILRSRPVQDPWASKKPDDETGSPSFLPKEALRIDNGSDALARRAQKNQERLQAAKRKSQPETPNLNDQPEVKLESEIRYISSNDKKIDSGLRVDDLIARRPVGGKGTLQNAKARTDTTSFIFSQGPDILPEVAEPVVEVPQKREVRTRRPSIPVLDKKGEPIFLTLEQAQSDFQSFLEQSGNSAWGDGLQSEEVLGWTDLGITDTRLLKNLNNMRCEKPLSVQIKACTSISSAMDVMIGTYTGSGKTLSFLVPLAQRILTGACDISSLQVLIVAPGRELASQIVSVARDLLQGTDVSVMLAIGGTGFERNLEQIRKRKPTILVGTPGRIAELVVGRPGDKDGRLKISDLQSLVLDEFDALLEYKPHRDPTRAIIESLKQRRGDRLQSVLCSATACDMVGSEKLEGFLRQGYVVATADDDDVLVTSRAGTGSGQAARVSRTVIHGVIHAPHRRFALETLRRILHTEPLPQQILIFAENPRKVDMIVEKLQDMGVIAAALHGGMGSEKMDRADVSKALREGYVGIVVATELAARGLDAPLLTHVINFDLPTDASHYAHRAGRCGRGGRPGVVINISTNPQERSVPLRFADRLGITMLAVEPRNGKLIIVDPKSQDLD
jgi:ATP-dependent RNA helicase DeaD